MRKTFVLARMWPAVFPSASLLGKVSKEKVKQEEGEDSCNW